MDHSLRKHAKYGASSAHRWMRCFGSVRLSEAAPPQPESPYAKDGTRAHELLDFALKNGYWDAREASIMADRIDEDTSFEAGERLEAIQVALDYVKALLDAYPDAVMYVERSFHFPSNVDPDNTFGTCDICIYIPSLDVLYVIDYKHGAGEPVEVEDNEQGLYYATGAVEGSGGLNAETICVVIIQPRCFHPLGPIREAVVPRTRLQDFVFEADNAILETKKPDAPLNPGPKQCRWCPANVSCPAREQRALAVVGQTFASVKVITKETLPDARTLPMDRIAYILDAASLLEDFLSDVYNVAFNYAMSGGTIPNRKLVEAQARRRFYGEELHVAQQLMALANLDPNKVEDWDKVYPRKLINITTAETLIKQAFRKQHPKLKVKDTVELANKALAALTLKETSGNLKLVPLNDPRPPANRAERDFANVTVLPTPKGTT